MLPLLPLQAKAAVGVVNQSPQTPPVLPAKHLCPSGVKGAYACISQVKSASMGLNGRQYTSHAHGDVACFQDQHKQRKTYCAPLG